MTPLPLIVLALPAKGPLTIERAGTYLRACSNQDKYRVECCLISGFDALTGIKDSQKGEGGAYNRAKLGLEKYPEAVVSIGLQSHTKILDLGTYIRPIPTAFLALVLRNAVGHPFIHTESGSDYTTQARLVAKALGNWRKHMGPAVSHEAIAAQAAKIAACA